MREAEPRSLPQCPNSNISFEKEEVKSGAGFGANDGAGKKRSAPRKKRPAKPALRIATAPDIRCERGETELEVYAVIDDAGRVVGRGNRQIVANHLSRYCKRGEITQRQFVAGAKFARDQEGAVPDIRSCLNAQRGGGDAHEYMLAAGGAAVHALHAYSKALAALGPLALIVTWVAVFGRPAASWATHHGRPARDGIAVLREGLQALADHYGLDR